MRIVITGKVDGKCEGTVFTQRHPERSRGIFLAGGDNVVCETAEKWKPFVKGTRKNRVQGRFLAALEMTTGGV